METKVEISLMNSWRINRPELLKSIYSEAKKFKVKSMLSKDNKYVLTFEDLKDGGVAKLFVLSLTEMLKQKYYFKDEFERIVYGQVVGGSNGFQINIIK